MNQDASNSQPPRITPPGTPQHRGRPTQSTRIWVSFGLIVLLIALLAVVRTMIARRIPELTDARLDAALQRWNSHGPEDYRLEVQIEGLRPGDVSVEVQQGKVVKMTRDGRTPSQRRTWDVWSVPGMFDMIERELELAEDPAGEMDLAQDTRLWLRCEFDSQYGCPVEFHRAVFGGGPEVYWRVVRFEVP